MDQQTSFLEVFQVREITQTLGIACCDPHLLVQLSLTQTHLHDIIFACDFAPLVAKELHRQGVSWAKRCNSLEEISLGISVESICSQSTKNHLYFQFGGGTTVQPETKPLLDRAALLARKHRRLRVHIDSHVASIAPSGAATMTSQCRAESVVAELGNRGIADNRMSIRAWGRKVSSVWEELEDDTAARAELFFSLDDVEFPPRQAYYNLVPEDMAPPIGTTEEVFDEEPSDEESSDDEDDENTLVRLPDGQVVPLRFLQAIVHKHQGDDDDKSNGLVAECSVMSGHMGSILQKASSFRIGTKRQVSAPGQFSQDTSIQLRQVSDSLKSEDLEDYCNSLQPPARQSTSVLTPKNQCQFMTPRMRQVSDSLKSDDLEGYCNSLLPPARQTTSAFTPKNQCQLMSFGTTVPDDDDDDDDYEGVPKADSFGSEEFNNYCDSLPAMARQM